ncbi:MAG: hypothetical protein ACPG47_02225 [Leucothrix sp.]
MNATTKLPLWFWAIGILALLYFLMDSMMLYNRVFMPDELANSMPKLYDLYQKMPIWVNGVYALEIFGGLMGALALLSKKKWAFILFCVSMIGVLAQTSYLWFVSDSIAVLGKPAIVMPAIAIVLGVILIMVSRSAISRGWIR